MTLTDFLNNVADAIRTKDGTTEFIVAIDFPQRILDIPSGSGMEITTSSGAKMLKRVSSTSVHPQAQEITNTATAVITES